MTPEQSYQHAIENLGFTPDPVQLEAVQLTQQLYLKLTSESAANTSRYPLLKTMIAGQYWQRLSTAIRQRVCSHQPSYQGLYKPGSSVTGLYFWGGVGRGKTWLIDSFFNTLPFPEKRRIHFHRFMQEVHEQLKDLPKTPNPLNIVAQQMAQRFRLLCIDEFHVQDITDAMLLAGLLEALFSYGVTLVTTSNIAPDDLYKNGLQRERFLPAIEWIKQYTRVFELNNETDYRHQVRVEDVYYHTPLDKASANRMLQHFIGLSNYSPVCAQNIEINKRPIQVIALNHPSGKHPQSVVWFEFNELCNTARSNSDYLLLAEQYSHILISNVYRMDEQKDAVAKRFMHLIDALYDRHCGVILSAETEPDELYHGRRLEMPFQRTASRLKEMRSKLYRAKLKL